ncbi:MAG: urea ABC transporter permease subunit UrtB [Hyphomicrobiales bacterium]|nr:urea ABC transporter permease subunit UrtB [Hyphomicrobiales bacterium]
MVIAVGAARADALTDALAKFSSGGFAGPVQAVRALAATADPRAATALAALRDGRLYLDVATGAVVVKGADGALADAATGAARATGDGLRRIAVTNPMRRILDAIGGQTGLAGKSAIARAKAADAVYASHDVGARDALRAALARETDPAAKAAMERAVASVAAFDPAATGAEKSAAVRALRKVGDEKARALLAEARPGATPALRGAIGAAIAAIDFRLAIWRHAQDVWYGLTLGAVLLLVAIGLAITFGVMGVINMAHGEMAMLGAYSTYVVQLALAAWAPAAAPWSLAFALPVAFLVSGGAGVIVERGVIRRLYDRPLETLLATFGVSLILQQAVRSAFGADNRDVSTPPFMAGEFRLGALAIGWGRLWIVVFALVVFAALLGLLKLTPFGLRLRAVMQNRRMASAMGIDTARVDALAFGLGSGVAGLAGVALSQIDNVSPNLGQGYIIDCFMVVVFGGVGNLWGAFFAAFLLGVVNKLLEPVAGAVLGKIAVLVFVILFIQRRPRGLFAPRGRAVEA